MDSKKELLERGIVKDKKAKALKYFCDVCPDFFSVDYSKPSEYIESIWNDYKKLGIKENATNGRIFEYIIATLLIRERVFPFYFQAEITFVSNVNFDIFIYTEDGPITLSIKTTLRERYKQAVLEADAILSVHKRALNYLISLDEIAIEEVNRKIERREIISLEKALNVFSADFDRMIYKIKSKVIFEAPMINIVQKEQAIIKY